MNFIRRRGRREEDLEQEIKEHLRMAERDHIDRGEDPEQARLAVRREFGNVDMVKETVRNIWGWIWLDRLIQDLRYGLRMIRRNPGFSAAVVVTLALGIGANISIFRVLNAVDLRPLPVRNPEELVQVQGLQNGAPQVLFDYSLYREINSNQKVVEGFFASAFMFIYDVHINGRGLTDRVGGRFITGNYFRVFGTRTQIGRAINESDDQPSAAPVAVISDRFWRKEFGASPDAIGSTITINKKMSVTVIGVTPLEFFGEIIGEIPDLWIPISIVPPKSELIVAFSTLAPLARLRPDVPREEAQSGLNVICSQWLNHSKHQSNVKDFRIVLIPLGRGKSRLKEFLGPLWLLMAIAGFVMLIACCNLASLFLARAGARAHEVGVRMAIGASRIRLVRQFMTESLFLASIGGVLGFTFGTWGSRGLIALVTSTTSSVTLHLSANLDWRVLSFALSITIVAACLFGLAPALSTSRMQLNAALQTSRRSHTDRTEHRAAKVFIVAQLSISLVLIAGALLLMRSFWNIYYQHWGFQPDHILIMDLAYDPQTSEIRMSLNFREALQQRLSVIPGVISAAFASEGPLRGLVFEGEIALPDRPQESDPAQFIQVSPHYFETMDIPIIAGRPITEKDTKALQPVAVISQTAARKLFGAANPVGRCFIAKNMGDKSAIQIVGVAHDVRYYPREPFGILIFWPIGQAQYTNPSPSWFIRTKGDPMPLIQAVRSAVHEVNPNVRVGNLLPWGQVILSNIRHERMLAWIAGGLGLLAIILACVGLYGVVSFGVQRRTQEIGIRLALGATRSRVQGFLLREAVLLIVAGIAIGGASTLALVRWMRSVLFGLSPHDPAMMITAVLLLCFVAVAGAYLSARRASHLDPMESLRQE
jgi:predicted permease